MSQKAFRDVFINHLFQTLSGLLWNTSCSRSGSLNTANSHHSLEIVSKAMFQTGKYSSCWNADFCAADKREDSKIKHLRVGSGVSFQINYHLIREIFICIFFYIALSDLFLYLHIKTETQLKTCLCWDNWFPAFIWLSGYGIWSVQFALLSFHLL